MKEPGDILDPLQALHLIQLGQMNGNTTPNLPPELIRLIGLYMLIDKLKQLLGLVEFTQKQYNANWAPPLADVSNTLNNAIKNKHTDLYAKIYNAALATVTEFIAGSETKLLHAAAKAGNRLAVAQLLKVKGIDVNAKDNKGYTALMWAAWTGQEAVVEQLHAKGSNVNAKDNLGSTALMEAVWAGRDAVVVQLLAKGSNVNAKDKRGYTALMHAAIRGREPVVAALLKVSGIEVNAKPFYWWGDTALILAARYGREAVVHALCLKQLLDAPSDAIDATLLRLNAEIKKENRSMTITPLSLCDYLLASLEKLPTQDEKRALLNKALSNDNAFSVLMQQAELKQRLQTELGKLNTPSTPVIFSTTPPTETRAATNSACIIG